MGCRLCLQHQAEFESVMVQMLRSHKGTIAILIIEIGTDCLHHKSSVLQNIARL